MKKLLLFLGGALLLFVIIAALLLLTGKPRSDVFLRAFELSEDGNTMTLHVGLSTSAGYLRKMEVKQGGENKYITFYSTPGINSKIGAKDSFELSLNPSATEIYFYSGGGAYKKVLEKNEATGQWHKVQ